jgi:hypothetical protein
MQDRRMSLLLGVSVTAWLHDHETWAVWGTGIGTIILATGVLVAIGQLRDARMTRHMELLADLTKRWDEPAIIESVEEGRKYGRTGLIALVQKLNQPVPTEEDLAGSFIERQRQLRDLADARDEDLDDWLTALKWPFLLETMGVLAFQKAIPVKTVYQVWGLPITEAWENEWSEVAAFQRSAKQDDNLFRYFRWLADKMKEEQRKDRAFATTYQRARQSGPVGAAIAVAWFRTLAESIVESQRRPAQPGGR